MKRLLLLFIFLGAVLLLQAQQTQLQIVKNGKVKKRIYTGQIIKVIDWQHNAYFGPLVILNDTMVLFNDVFIPVSHISKVILVRAKEKQPFDWVRFGYTTLGVVLSTAGMSLAKWEPFHKALVYSAVLGYSSYALQAISKIPLKKRKFKMNRRREVRIWSIINYQRPLPVKKAF
jgi:hypothetical protein